MKIKRLQEILENVLHDYGDVDVTMLDPLDPQETLSVNCASVWKVETEKGESGNVLLLSIVDPRH